MVKFRIFSKNIYKQHKRKKTPQIFVLFNILFLKTHILFLKAKLLLFFKKTD